MSPPKRNLTGSVENQKNNSRIMSGEIPEIPRNLKFLQAIFLANNNFSGSIPSSLSDTIGLMYVGFYYFVLIYVIKNNSRTFANNTFLSGPLPASSIQLKSQTPQWTNTMRCNFNGTGLCVPPNWKYQPACIRTIANSIPTCSNDSLPVSSAPVLGIDPRDPGPLLLQPFPDSQDNTPAFGSFSDVLRYAGISIFFMIVLAGTWIWWRNRMYRDAYNRALTQEQERQQVEERRRMEEFELPEYTPALPEYHHNATPGASTGGVVSERREEAPFIVSTGGTHGTGTDSERNPRTVS
ncbi:hypothetical protein BDR26DRAFT_27528 [Obelidium mucronatum]|nr:hypothetical protein BDR26DRAFT_27528 [Obelidium mucronatum]